MVSAASRSKTFTVIAPVALLLLVAGSAAWQLHHLAPRPGTTVIGQGKIVSLQDNRSADGPLILTIKQGTETFVLSVASAFSVCDQQAITVPYAKEKIGATIRFKGVTGSDKTIVVCKTDTYIR